MRQCPPSMPQQSPPLCVDPQSMASFMAMNRPVSEASEHQCTDSGPGTCLMNDLNFPGTDGGLGHWAAIPESS